MMVLEFANRMEKEVEMDIIQNLTEEGMAKQPSVVLPEATDKRVLSAASRLHNDGVFKPILIGKVDEINGLAKKWQLKIDGIRIEDPTRIDYFDELLQSFVKRRRGKILATDAWELLNRQVNYFGTMLVYTGRADAMVSGAVHSTADTVRPALQIVKTKPAYKKVSGVFLLIRGDEIYMTCDGAVNIDPTKEDLAEQAVQCHETATKLGIEPRIAMLSFSTRGSAKHEEVTKVAGATALARELNPDMLIDGEVQFDTAVAREVQELKAPDSPLKGNANVFIFPNIAAGNIGYKIAQRLGGFKAIGPVLQGLNAPINDLSRGCVEDEICQLCSEPAALAD